MEIQDEVEVDGKKKKNDDMAMTVSSTRNKKSKSSKKEKKEKGKKDHLFHVIHKLPSGDGPYVKAKHAQLVDKDPEAAIVLFWKAINAGDKVDSSLKDMAVVMKQLDRTEEAIEAIKSFRGRCPKQAQDSLDNVLIDLYKKSGNAEEQIALLRRKLWLIYQGEAFNGRTTKTARSHGRKFQVSVQQEISRLLGNLGWAYMQQYNYVAAEVVYKKAQIMDPDANKANNLGLCLIKQARYDEAHYVLNTVLLGYVPGSNDYRSRKRARDLMKQVEASYADLATEEEAKIEEVAFVAGLELVMDDCEWAPSGSKRLPIFEEISSFSFRDQLAC